MHHIFVNESIINQANRVIILDKQKDEDTFNHLKNSLRINVGEKILCSAMPFQYSFDYLCEVVNVRDDSIELHIIEETASRELNANINLYQGICKSDKFEFIIEKAVELGVTTITPIATEYCVAKIDEKKSEKKIERYTKIAKSAAEQSKRHIIPNIKSSVRYEDFIKDVKITSSANDYTFNLLFYENANGISETRQVLDNIKKVVANNGTANVNVVIGPEGGFSQKEIDLAKNSGFYILSLGDRILRTETAAVTALSIIMYELS